MKIQTGKVEITFTQEERDIIKKFLSLSEICEELAEYFYDDMPDSMIIE